MTDDKKMNVLFSCDDNYAQHLGAAIYSLLVHNQEFDSIDIYVIDNEISQENKDRLYSIVFTFPNAEIVWIPFQKWRKKLKLNMAWNISVSTYARLFVADMLPDKVKRVIYMDCDIIVCGSFADLWNTNLCGKILGAVQDTICDATKKAVGLKPEQAYFNAGILLIDLAEWRKYDVEKRCLQFIAEHNGKVIHHDQGTLNGVLQKQWFRLPPVNNLMTIHYIYSRKKINKFFNDHAEFYSDEEIKVAKEMTLILHYTPSFTSRPWMNNCRHPRKNLYWEAVECTPWKGAVAQKDDSKWYVKLINWRYRNLPV